MIHDKLEWDLCCGCGACVSKCPTGCLTMEPDEYGFLYPKLHNTDQCINCGRCETVCPVLQRGLNAESHPDVYAAYAKCDTIRLKSSSGGVFYILAQEVLKKGGNVYAAAYDENFIVRHICVSTLEALPQLCGAKYAQSDLGDTFRKIRLNLHDGIAVLFCGTPCQVAGLKSYLGSNEPLLFCVDFVCHSIPSPLAWDVYKNNRRQLDGYGRRPVQINQRSKISGWSRYRYSTQFDYDETTSVVIPSYQDLFMRLFIKNCISRKSCSTCTFKGNHRSSDITLGDFWGIWDIAPEMDDDKGTSLVLVHTEAGRAIFSEVREALIVKEVTWSDAVKHNSALISAAAEHPGRDLVLEYIRCSNFAAAEKQIANPKRSKTGFITRIKRLLIKE